jgi:hypothetical protein
MPSTLGPVVAGEAALFEDPRVDWAIRKLAEIGFPIGQSNVLELGPLEGGHTYKLIKEGAKTVTAIEAHSEAFLKCLVLKEVLSMERVNFLYGDAMAFLRVIGHKYDVGFVSGFLYHMANPVELIELLTKRTNAIYIWTVFWDKEFSDKNPTQPAGSAGTQVSDFAGFRHTLHKHDYGKVSNYGNFWGGPDSFANWMEGNQILEALSYFGFSKQIVEFEKNPNGSAMRLVATRA